MARSDENALWENYRDALENAASRFSIGIFFGLALPHLDMASAIAISWKMKRLIVTAGHIFNEANLDQTHLILPLDRPFDRGDRVHPPTIISAVAHFPVPRSSIVKWEQGDLCYFEVDDAFGNSTDLDFYELPSFARTPPPRTKCLMLGFPNDLSQQISANEVEAHLAARWSHILDMKEEIRFFKNSDSRTHFMMQFHKADKGETAPGFSGAGVWFPVAQPQGSTLWRPNVGLAGIQSSWYPRKKITLAVRVEQLVSFLSDKCDR